MRQGLYPHTMADGGLSLGRKELQSLMRVPRVPSGQRLKKGCSKQKQ